MPDATAMTDGRRKARDKSPPPEFPPRQKFKVENRESGVTREIEIIAPDFSPRQKRAKGRPPNPAKFVIRPFDGGFGVWLVRPSEKRKYCCHLKAREVEETRYIPFDGFGEYVLDRIAEREQTAENATRISALVAAIKGLIENCRDAKKGAATA